MSSISSDQWDPERAFTQLYKNILIEHCKKMNWPDPIYDVEKHGPDHIPTFTATVSVNNVKLKGEALGRRVDAEQSAAKEALIDIYTSASQPFNICMLVHEAGLWKPMLNDYAQFKALPFPNFDFRSSELPKTRRCFTCTITIGDTKYEGPCGKNKKDAEKNACLFACTTIMNALPSAPTVEVFSPINT